MGTTLTPVVSQAILTALAARIANQDVFTAYDVTTDARDGTTDNVRHRDVRDIVANEFAVDQFPDDYNREAIELDVPGNPYAMVYFPDGKTAQDHPKAAQQIAQPQVAPPVAPIPPYVSQAQASSTTKQGGAVKDGDGFICSVTSKGVINIPHSIVSKVTPNGGSYDLQVGGSLICKRPDGDGRLRISSSKLGGGSQFRLEVSTHNTITIESA